MFALAMCSSSLRKLDLKSQIALTLADPRFLGHGSRVRDANGKIEYLRVPGSACYPRSRSAMTGMNPASLEEFFPVRPQVELKSPSRAILFDQSPIDFSNGCRIHERFVEMR